MRGISGIIKSYNSISKDQLIYLTRALGHRNLFDQDFNLGNTERNI